MVVPSTQVRSGPIDGTVVAVRPREPDRTGYTVRSGVRLYYEVFGDGPVTVLLLPTWAIVASKVWKLQIPFLARHFRVVTFDPRGNGRSDRPPAPADYADHELVDDAVAVLDATGTDSAVCVGLSMGAGILLRLAVTHPSRVAGAVFVGSTLGRGEVAAERGDSPFETERASYEGWEKYNANYWREDYAGFAEFFFGHAFPESHSSKQIDDAVSWALDTDAGTLIATERADYLAELPIDGRPIAAHLAAQVTCPCLVVHGDDDRISTVGTGVALAEALDCAIEIFRGGGHCVQARHPVRFNVLMRNFVQFLPVP
ncbi:MAG: alpha/beta fold hydrolase [Pseudonocardiales bacterium]|nr:alpha/beta fold hydrolase [Pseudonocardiales bacterium]